MAALLVAAITAATFSFGCGKETPAAPVIPEDPIEAVIASDEASTKAMGETDLGKVLDNMQNGGSFELFIDLAPIMGMAGMTDADMSAALKLFVSDGEQAKGALLLDVLSGDASLFDAAAFVDGTDISFTSAALLGKDAYGIDLSTAADDIASSEVFASAMEVDGFAEILDAYTEVLQSSANIEAQNAAFNEKIENDMIEILKKHGEITSEDGKFTVGGKAIDTKDVVFAYSGEQLMNLASDIMVYLRDSDDVRAFIESFAEGYSVAGSMTADELLEIYDESLSQVIDAAAEVPADEIADVSAVIKVYISKANGEMIGMTVDIAAKEDTVGVKVVMGPSVKDLDELSFSVSQNGETMVDAGYRVTADSGNEFKAEIAATANGDTLKLAELSYDRGSKEYKLTVGDINAGTAVSLMGTYTADDNTVKLGIGSIASGGMSISLGETAVIFNASAEMPAFPTEYTNIFRMSEDEFRDFADTIAESAEAFGSLFG